MAPEHGIYLYYDWHGRPFDTLEQFADYFDAIGDRTVAKTSVLTGHGTIWTIETCWTRVDAPVAGFPHNEVLIFTTTVTRPGGSGVQTKAPNAGKAQEAHDIALAFLLETNPDAVVLP